MKERDKHDKRYDTQSSRRITYTTARWEKGVNSLFDIPVRSLRLSSVSWKFTTTVSWLTVAWKRAKFAACREEQTIDGVRPIHRGVVPRVLAWRAAKIKKEAEKKKNTSAAICQYGNKAGSLSLTLLPPSISLPLSISYGADINRRTMSTQKCRQMGFPPSRYVARMLSPFPSLSWNHPQCSLS